MGNQVQRCTGFSIGVRNVVMTLEGEVALQADRIRFDCLRLASRQNLRVMVFFTVKEVGEMLPETR